MKQIDFSNISFIMLDMDGVLTDASIIYTSTGEQIKRFSAYDGYGVERARNFGLNFAIISGRETPVNKYRADVMKITELHQNCPDKILIFEQLKEKYGLEDHNFCYVGDDVFDIPLLKRVAFSCAPANAMKEVKDIVDYVSVNSGGKGAVREIIDCILKNKGLI
jgi:3-deoxy-D-manno-octulosonate 8-phosphate phosphatase (KDO 8-P phosphatase)